MTDEEIPQEPVGKWAKRKDYALQSAGKIVSWVYLIPLLIAIAVMLYTGMRLVYVAAMVGGILVWNYWGNKMSMRDPKLVLIVDVETLELNPIFVGRKLWGKMKTVGKPRLNFKTPAGYSVEVVKRFDPEKLIVEYPHDNEYSDLMLAAIPERYGELIDELVKVRNENYKLTTEKKLETTRDGIKKAQHYAAEMDKIINDTFTPKDATKRGE